MRTIAYRNFPTLYADTLRNKGQRSKARAFWEYHYDMEVGEHNAVRFYSKSWAVAISTAHSWIEDFKSEIDKYHAGWWLKNQQHYSSVKNQPERSEHLDPNTMNSNEALEIGECESTPERSEQSDPNKALNLYDGGDGAGLQYWNDPKFNDLFFIYGMNTKFKGKKEDAYEAYKRVQVNHEILKLAAVHYLHDKSMNKKLYNLTNFLKNDVYVSYMPKRLEIKIGDVWVLGTYDEVKQVFTADSGNQHGLSSERLVTMYEEQVLRFVNSFDKAG